MFSVILTANTPISTEAGHCHQEIFERLVFSSLEAFTEEVEIFIRETHESPEKVIGTWKKLEPYRVTIPQTSDPVSVDLFLSNVRIALAILEERAKRNPLC